MRKFIAGFFLAAATAGALVACGGDDQYVQPGNTGDGGLKTDGGNDGGGKTDGGPGTDGGDGGACAFTAFVIDQVQNQKKDTTQPVQTAAIPDPTCSIDNAAAFTPLFP